MSKTSRTVPGFVLKDIPDLLHDFPPPPMSEWQRLAEASLRGGSTENALVTHTYEEIDLRPLYRAADLAAADEGCPLPGFFPYKRGTEAEGWVRRPWDVAQRITAASASACNDLLQSELGRGLTSIHLVLDRSTRQGLDPDADAGEIHPGALALRGVADLETLFAGIDPTRHPLFMACGASALPMISMMMAFLDRVGAKRSDLHGWVTADPLGQLIGEGRLPLPLATAFDHMKACCDWSGGCKTILASGIPYHEGGANAVQELAFTLSTAVAYVEQMLDRGLEIDTIAPQIGFEFGIGPHFFMEISKIRAARTLWANVVSAYGGNAASQRMGVAARTSLFNHSGLDPHVNMLRATTSSLSAVLGGVDALHVASFDESFRESDRFSRRIARNIQLILREESHLDLPIDPAAGSHFVEWLTNQLAREAWSKFRGIQTNGGMVKAIGDGLPQTAVAETAARRADDLARRRAVLVGTNAYVNPEEKVSSRGDASAPSRRTGRGRPPDRYPTKNREGRREILKALETGLLSGAVSPVALCARAYAEGATLGEVSERLSFTVAETETCVPIPLFRLAEPFERLRRRVDRDRAKIALALLPLGAPVETRARMDFARNVFAVAGLAAQSLPPAGDERTALERIDAAGAEVLVLCATDERYEQEGESLVKSLKRKRPRMRVMVCGMPPGARAALLDAGVDGFLHRDMDVLAFLSRVLERTEVAE